MSNVLVQDVENSLEVKPTLADVVSDILTKYGHPNPNAWRAGLPSDALNAETDVGVQKFLLSRHWSMLLGEMPQDTRTERFYLNDAVTVKDWLKIFEEVIVKKVLIVQVSTPVAVS